MAEAYAAGAAYAAADAAAYTAAYAAGAAAYAAACAAGAAAYAAAYAAACAAGAAACAADAAAYAADAAARAAGAACAAGAATWRRLYAIYWHCRGPVGVSFRPSWRSAEAVGLARAIYAGRAFDRFPILADAIEEAGCDLPEVLNHLRTSPAEELAGSEWVLWNLMGYADR